MLKPIGLLALLSLFLIYPSTQLRAQDSTPTLEFRLADDNDSAGWQKLKLRGSDKPIFVAKEVSINGGHIARVSFYKDPVGNPSVGLTLTDDGAKAMKKTTSQNLKKRLAIVLNGKVVSAPIIQSTISKEVQISGRFDRDDLLAFFQAIVLREMP